MTPKEKAIEYYLNWYNKCKKDFTIQKQDELIVNNCIDIALKSQAEEIIKDIMKRPRCQCASVTHNERDLSIKRKIVNMIKQKHLEGEDE